MQFVFLYEMAKRTNPFIEDFVPQSKVHVGMKQFNNNEDRLKKVYEKTLLLLFKGAKKCPTQELLTSEDNALSATDKRDKMKQLFIVNCYVDEQLPETYYESMTPWGESIRHVISGCSHLANSEYFYILHRHNEVARIILQELALKYNLLNSEVDCKLGVKQCTCGSSVESQCAYCEVHLCCDCQQLCVRCERSYCLRCTMIGQEGSEVCVSCYS